jgi:hypothetical protein
VNSKANFLAFSSMSLFLIALVLPFEKDSYGVAATWSKLLTGWWFVITGQSFAWLSIPLLSMSWTGHFAKHAMATLIFASSGLILALPLMKAPFLAYGWGDSIKTAQQIPQAGYYLVLLCLILQILASVFARLSELEHLAQEKAQTTSQTIPLTRSGLSQSPWGWWLTSALGIALVVGLPTLLKTTVQIAVKQTSLKPLPPSNYIDPLGRRMIPLHHYQPLNDVPHAPPGALPPGLQLRASDRELIVTNITDKTLEVRVWHTQKSSEGQELICHLMITLPTNQMNSPDWWENTVDIAPGKSTTFSDAYARLISRDECNENLRYAKFEFIVVSKDVNSHPYAFISDTVFLPQPPPHARGIAAFWVHNSLAKKHSIESIDNYQKREQEIRK